MSTSGIIARQTGDGWEGTWCHFDAYPTWLGKELWRLLQKEFRGDIKTFLRKSIDEHMGGWRHYPNICYCHHGLLNLPHPTVFPRGQPWTSKDEDNFTNNWVYAFDPNGRTLAIFNPGYDQRVDAFYWRLLVVIDLHGREEPDWLYIEQMGEKVLYGERMSN